MKVIKILLSKLRSKVKSSNNSIAKNIIGTGWETLDCDVSIYTPLSIEYKLSNQPILDKE